MLVTPRDQLSAYFHDVMIITSTIKALVRCDLFEDFVPGRRKAVGLCIDAPACL